MTRYSSAGGRLLRPTALAALCALLAVQAYAAEALREEPVADARATAAAQDWLPWAVYGVSGPNSSITRLENGVTVTRSADDVVSLSRKTGADAALEALVVRFNLSLSGATSTATAAQVLRLGANFSTSNEDESDAATFARIGINSVEAGGGFQLRDLSGGVNSRTFAGTQAITWVLNHSGEMRAYSAPDGTKESVANDRMDVWVGRDKVFDDALVATPRAGMSDIKWFWSGGAGATTINYFEVRPLADFTGGASAIPEVVRAPVAPADMEALAGTGGIQLYRPSPNPFETTTRYAYAISSAPERVDIGVYDVAGRLIRNLARDVQSPGRYEVEWDGRAGDGTRVRNGVYFLRASVGAQQRVARLVYLDR